jgi:uncharacterized protein
MKHSKHPEITFPNDAITYITPTWDEMDQLTFLIAKEILNNELTFDRIITLSKGGWPMARSLIDFLDGKEVASIGLKSYTGIQEKAKIPTIYQDLPVDISGENLLLFDDVADTGDTLEFIYQYLLDKGAKSVTIACLYYKPHSSVKPDYFGAETTAWIIFPYEFKEMMNVLLSKWEDEGLSRQEILARFEKLNFPKYLVEYFYGGEDSEI